MQSYIRITIPHEGKNYGLNILQEAKERSDFIKYTMLESPGSYELRLPWLMTIYQTKKTQEIELDRKCKKPYQILLAVKIFEAIQEELRKKGVQRIVDCQVKLSSSIPSVMQFITKDGPGKIRRLY